MVPTAKFRPISRKYQYLCHLQGRNVHLHYAGGVDASYLHLTVGEACRKCSYMFELPPWSFSSVNKISNADQIVGGTVLPFWGLVIRVTVVWLFRLASSPYTFLLGA